MKSQPEQTNSCAPVQKKLNHFKNKPTTETTFFENTTVEIMAKLMGSDKDTIMEKYCDNTITTEEMDEYLYRLASVANMGAEVLCRSLNEDQTNI